MSAIWVLVWYVACIGVAIPLMGWWVLRDLVNWRDKECAKVAAQIFETGVDEHEKRA